MFRDGFSKPSQLVSTVQVDEGTSRDIQAGLITLAFGSLHDARAYCNWLRKRRVDLFTGRHLINLQEHQQLKATIFVLSTAIFMYVILRNGRVTLFRC